LACLLSVLVVVVIVYCKPEPLLGEPQLITAKISEIISSHTTPVLNGGMFHQGFVQHRNYWDATEDGIMDAPHRCLISATQASSSEEVYCSSRLKPLSKVNHKQVERISFKHSHRIRWMASIGKVSAKSDLLY
jgi:hypothetical protein